MNAVHARYEGGPGGVLPSGQSADAIIGQVVCRTAGPDVNVPTTSSTVTTQPVPTTIPPAVTVVRVTTTTPANHPDTGSSSHLTLGLVALATGVALRRQLRGGRPSARAPG